VFACSLLGSSPLELKSPDGRYVASVRHQGSAEARMPSVWLRPARGRDVLVQRLSRDEYCRRIVWSSDSALVAFIIQDLRILIINAADQQTLKDWWPVNQNDGSPSWRIEGFAFHSARSARFLMCRVTDAEAGDSPCSAQLVQF
jgi:hypothetical protein